MKANPDLHVYVEHSAGYRDLVSFSRMFMWEDIPMFLVAVDGGYQIVTKTGHAVEPHTIQQIAINGTVFEPAATAR